MGNDVLRGNELRPMLTMEDVQKILKVSRATLERRVRRGEIPAYKIGRNVRFKAQDIEQYIQSKQIQPKKK